jgi:hypothetical protein
MVQIHVVIAGTVIRVTKTIPTTYHVATHANGVVAGAIVGTVKDVKRRIDLATITPAYDATVVAIAVTALAIYHTRSVALRHVTPRTPTSAR